MGIRYADLPRLHGNAGIAHRAVGALAGAGASVGEAAGVAGIADHALDIAVIGHRPVHLSFHVVRPRRQGNGILAEPLQCLHRRAEAAERGEHQLDGLRDGAVRIQGDLARVGVDQADGQAQLEFAALRLAALPADQPGADALKLILRQCPLQPEQELVVAVVGIVHAGLVQDEGVGDGGDLQQLVPVGVVAAQTRDFQAQHEADFPGGDTRHEIAEAATVGAVRAGLALVVVNGADALIGPAERDRALTQTVLATRALGVLQHLVHGGLADIQTRLAPAVIVGDLVGHGLKHGGILRLHVRAVHGSSGRRHE